MTIPFPRRRVLGALASVPALGWPAFARAQAAQTLLNVSYDVSREFYKDFNAAFAAHWKKTTGQDVTVNQSHAGSSRQARSVIDGLQADVITMNQHNDIDVLHQRGNLVPADWTKRLPNNASPTTSVSVILVRKGQPERHPRLERPGPPGSGGHHPEPEDERQRPLHVSRRVGAHR